MTFAKRVRCYEVSCRRLRGSSWLLSLSCFLLGLAACGPPWWRKGRPRKVRICAEVELLSRLAELLMPQTPIGELFRDFPAGPSREPQWLSPGIAAFGVLEDEGAALFVEYDRTDRNSDEQAQNDEELKTKALLHYAPAGSRVLRIGHRARDFGWQQKSLDAVVNVWREGHEASLMKAVSQSVWVLLSSCDIALREDVHQRLHRFAVTEPKTCLRKACEFSTKVLLASEVKTKKANVTAFLKEHLDFSQSRSQALVGKFPRILRSVEGRLKPIVAWLEDVGLSRKQVAKVVAGFPPVLSYSLEANLKPTVAWLGAVGLSRMQVAKAICASPSVLGRSIEAKLKPTAAWLEDVGLSRKQVVKAVAGHPQILGYSVEANLKRTVAWLEGLGLSRRQVTKVLALEPKVLGYSLEANLKPTVAWLEDVGLSRQQVVKAISVSPGILGCSVGGNLEPTVAWLEDLGLSRQQVAKVTADSPSVLGLSIEANLKPKVAWLGDVGLNREQAVKVVVGFPQLFGLSIEAKLNPTVALFQDVGLNPEQVAKVIVRLPKVFSYSIDTKLKPVVMWLEEVGLTQLQVARVIAAFPQVLSVSIEKNLSPKHLFLLEHLSGDEVRDMILRLPALLGFSFSRLRHRLHVLQNHDAVSNLAFAMTLTDAHFAKKYPC